MQKLALLAAIQQEIHRHDFSHFVDETAIGRGRRTGLSGGRMSSLPEADQFDESIPRPSGERCDAGVAGQALKRAHGPSLVHTWLSSKTHELSLLEQRIAMLAPQRINRIKIGNSGKRLAAFWTSGNGRFLIVTSRPIQCSCEKNPLGM
jgi:hypothetical protein